MASDPEMRLWRVNVVIKAPDPEAAAQILRDGLPGVIWPAKWTAPEQVDA